MTTVSVPSAPTIGFWQRFHRMDETQFGLMLLVPNALVMLAFLIIPILYSVTMSFQQIELTYSNDRTWVGIQNYVNLLGDHVVTESVPRTLYFAALTVAFGTILALGLALVLNEQFPGRGLARVLVLLPWAISPVVNGVMWKYLFNGEFGLFNAILARLGVIQHYINWLDSPVSSLTIAAVATTWKELPFLTLILLAALQSMPESLFRAAKMDGATAWDRFRHLTLPHLRATLLLVILLEIISALQVFDLIYVLTKGGPGYATTLLGYVVYINAFQRLSLGMGAALAIILAVFILIFSGLSLLFAASRRQAA